MSLLVRRKKLLSLVEGHDVYGLMSSNESERLQTKIQCLHLAYIFSITEDQRIDELYKHVADNNFSEC